ncbi:hypothetical protein [Streptomyces olivaceiscleroticus]|uniref:hypothetical protein n=1 Tax=Streptomyces olivaceiscleroticus TaxID=68245 RepID=UPI0031F7E769
MSTAPQADAAPRRPHLMSGAYSLPTPRPASPDAATRSPVGGLRDLHDLHDLHGLRDLSP